MRVNVSTSTLFIALFCFRCDLFSACLRVGFDAARSAIRFVRVPKPVMEIATVSPDLR
jgi:hypothetical protein